MESPAGSASSGPVPLTRPSGTVTFLFTDIEGSTARWDHDARSMQAALLRHDALLRGAIGRHGGSVFKTVGDAFCAAFRTPTDALAAALAAQQALAAEDFSAVGGIRVRMALHTGESEERDGDYFGPPLNRVARLLALGAGGQVLLSGVAAQLVRGRLPPDTELRDLGVHRLRDLHEPEHVFQLVAADLADAFPALPSAEAVPTNLSQPLTALIGRRSDVAEIATLLGEARVVTVLGTGGVGKTRVAIAAGGELLERFPDGVWFVDLSTLTDPALVTAEIAAALGMPEPRARPAAETLLAFLHRKQLLLMLDNCEHLLDAVREAVDAIARSCAAVRILATSREPLNVEGEEVYRLPSLSVPPAGRALDAARALDYEAVALFAARASAADRRFALTDRNAESVADICRRLDGIALAIELAAVHVKVLSLPQLADRLHERFRILTGGNRSALPRQQTMRAAIDWSYDLLDQAQARLLCSLALFSGTFTLDAAEAVGGGEADESDVLERLTALVDKSLVVAETDAANAARYRVISSIREYALGKLDASGERAARSAKLAAWALAFAEDAEARWASLPSRDWDALVEPERENLRAALTWTLDELHDPATGTRLAARLRRVWGRFAPAEGLRWIATAHACADGSPELGAALALAEAQVQVALRRYRAAYATATVAAQAYAALGDALGVAEARGFAGVALASQGRAAEAMPLLRDALAVYRANGAHQLAAFAVNDVAIAHVVLGEPDAARARFRDALDAFHALGNDRAASSVAGNLAEMEFAAGNPEAALALASEALTGDDRRHFAPAYLSNLAAYCGALGRWADARERALASIAAGTELHADVDVAFALQHLAAAAVFGTATPPQSTLERAARLLGFVDVRLAQLESARQYTEQGEYDRLVAALQAALDDATFQRCAEDGRHWDVARAVAEASLT